ncbi:MAG: hypothetical protein HY293_11525 [Planctomycetes bacterium]|nr:hypothetical protein [Planctomycetota bacterium]
MALLLLVPGCGREPGHIEKLYGSAVNLEVLKKPERVEAFRLRRPKTKEEDSPLYNKWPVALGPVAVDAKTAAQLSALLLDEQTFNDWDEAKGCIPTPGLMLRFSDSRQIDLAFCFECNIMFTYRGSAVLGGANFDRSHDLLLGHFISLFPADVDLPRLLYRKQ